MLEILKANVYTVLRYEVFCPKCHRNYDVDLTDYTDANNYSVDYVCSDCRIAFTAVMPGLTRVVEQRDEAAKQDGAGESPKSLRTED